MVKGKVDLSAQILMAVDLLYMGMVGRPFKMKEQSKGKPMREFDAAEFVGAAVAHLGVPTESAWRMCIIDFQTSTHVLKHCFRFVCTYTFFRRRSMHHSNTERIFVLQCD